MRKSLLRIISLALISGIIFTSCTKGNSALNKDTSNIHSSNIQHKTESITLSLLLKDTLDTAVILPNMPGDIGVLPSEDQISEIKSDIISAAEKIDEKISSKVSSESRRNSLRKEILESFIPYTPVIKLDHSGKNITIDNKNIGLAKSSLNGSYAKVIVNYDSLAELENILKEDMPHKELSKPVLNALKDGRIPEEFQHDFSSPVTLDILCKLIHEALPQATKKELSERYVIRKENLNNSDDYIRTGYLLGFIDDISDLDNTITREHMSKLLYPHTVELRYGYMCNIRKSVIDFDDISPDYLSYYSGSKMYILENKFQPKSLYTLDCAIADTGKFTSTYTQFYLRGKYKTTLLRGKKIIVDDHSVSMREIPSYDNSSNFYIDKLPSDLDFNIESDTIDFGPFYCDIDPVNKQIDLSFKKGTTLIEENNQALVRYLQLNCAPEVYEVKEPFLYGFENQIIQHESPKIISKTTPKESFVVGSESHNYLKNYIQDFMDNNITEGMTLEEKLYLPLVHVNEISKYQAPTGPSIPELAVRIIKDGKGVCSNYSIFYKYYLDALGIKNRMVSGLTYLDSTYSKDILDAVNLKVGDYSGHQWNAVHLDGEWKFINSTPDLSRQIDSFEKFISDQLGLSSYFRTGGFDYKYNSLSELNPLNIPSTFDVVNYLNLYFDTYSCSEDSVIFRSSKELNIPIIERYLHTVKNNNALYTVSYDADLDIYFIHK